VEIVVKGRNVEVPDHYRQHVSEKLHKVERYDDKIIRVDVELSHEKNPRQSDRCQRVEITCVSRGPIVRAEACAGDFYSALDAAIARLDARLRRSADRRRVHRGRRAPMSVSAATSGLTVASEEAVDATIAAERIERRERSDYTERELFDAFAGTAAINGFDGARFGGNTSNGNGPSSENYDDQPWHIVRMKEHPTEAMTLEDALFQMELVGHDFYLFMDKESGRPSVVYRRHAYDYGVITLATAA
jgi:ribosomal subunit interface protein